jgi:formylglycine-generating enzyme required for sulfatase activity
MNTWVDLREADPDPIARLYWGITGKKLGEATCVEVAPPVAQRGAAESTAVAIGEAPISSGSVTQSRAIPHQPARPVSRRRVAIAVVATLGLAGALVCTIPGLYARKQSQVAVALDAGTTMVVAASRDAAPIDTIADGTNADEPDAPGPEMSQPPVPRLCPPGMVRIPDGKFWMGSPAGEYSDEHPAHVVTLSAYCIDRTEVTVQAYAACVKAGGCKPAARTVRLSKYDPEADQWNRFCNGDERRDHPMNCVEWNQAEAYCEWARDTGRLPSEAEWEYAARGTDGRTYPWGNEPPGEIRLNACGSECVAMLKRDLNLDRKAMYNASDGWETTAPVGSIPGDVSPFRVLDMAGNVAEWTADYWSGSYAVAAAMSGHGGSADTPRVVRGGAWMVMDAALVRAANRNWEIPSRRFANVGFRCASEPSSKVAANGKISNIEAASGPDSE